MHPNSQTGTLSDQNHGTLLVLCKMGVNFVHVKKKKKKRERKGRNIEGFLIENWRVYKRIDPLPFFFRWIYSH